MNVHKTHYRIHLIELYFSAIIMFILCFVLCNIVASPLVVRIYDSRQGSLLFYLALVFPYFIRGLYYGQLKLDKYEQLILRGSAATLALIGGAIVLSANLKFTNNGVLYAASVYASAIAGFGIGHLFYEKIKQCLKKIDFKG